MPDSVVIVSAARTPIGGLLGELAGLQAWCARPSSALACRPMRSTRC